MALERSEGEERSGRGVDPSRVVYLALSPVERDVRGRPECGGGLMATLTGWIRTRGRACLRALSGGLALFLFFSSSSCVDARPPFIFLIFLFPPLHPLRCHSLHLSLSVPAPLLRSGQDRQSETKGAAASHSPRRPRRPLCHCHFQQTTHV